MNRGHVGYKRHASVSTKSRFMTVIETTPMKTADANKDADLLDRLLGAGFSPSKIMGDMQHGSGEFRKEALGHGIWVSAPLFTKS